MSNLNENTVPERMPTFEHCPDWGKGGQFLYDPVAKTRTRFVPEDAPAVEAAAVDAAPAQSDNTTAQDTVAAAPSTKPKKESTRA